MNQSLSLKRRVIYLKTVLPLLLLIALSPLWDRPSLASIAGVEVIHSQDQYRPGDRYPLIFRLSIEGPWSIHGTRAEGGDLIPTRLSFPAGGEIGVEEILFPGPELQKFEYTGRPVETYSGDVLVRATLLVKEDAGEGTRVIEGRLSYQACSSNACLPPEEVPVTLSVRIAPGGAPARMLNQDLFLAGGTGRDVKGPGTGGIPGAGLWMTLLGIFLGGLALNLTPCIYPLIPVTVSYFSGRGRELGGRPILHVLLYLAGLSLTNSALGLSAALSGGLLGAALQNPLVLILVAGILFSLALSFFGLWELRLPPGLARWAGKDFGGYFGSLFMGLTLGIIAAPCLGPFLLGLLTYVGQRGDPFLGFLYFFVLSLGLGLPLSALALFSGAADRLPLSGDWMVWVRKVMGWVLIGMAVYVIDPLIPEGAYRAVLRGGAAILAALHLGWLDRSGGSSRGFRHLKKGLGVLLAAGAILYLYAAGQEGPRVRWTPYDRTIVEEAAGEKRPLIIDFYAQWCGPCRAMDRTVFTDPEVVKLSRSFVTLRMDLTNRHPGQGEILGRYQVRGVPTFIFINRDGIEEKGLRIESYTDASGFLEAMNRLLKEPPSLQE